MALRLPKQGSVDRSVPLSSYLVTIAITDRDGNVIEKLGTPVGGPMARYPETQHGSLRGLTPAWRSVRFFPRTVRCTACAPAATSE